MNEKFEKECKHHGLVNHSYYGKGNNRRIRCCDCLKDAVVKRRKKVKAMSIEYKGGKCINCGYDKCSAALEFHHRDPNKKDFGIGASGNTYSWEKTKKELDKCDLMCSNCHRELHAEDK